MKNTQINKNIMIKFLQWFKQKHKLLKLINVKLNMIITNNSLLF